MNILFRSLIFLFKISFFYWSYVIFKFSETLNFVFSLSVSHNLFLFFSSFFLAALSFPWHGECKHLIEIVLLFGLGGLVCVCVFFLSSSHAKNFLSGLVYLYPWWCAALSHCEEMWFWHFSWPETLHCPTVKFSLYPDAMQHYSSCCVCKSDMFIWDINNSLYCVSIFYICKMCFISFGGWVLLHGVNLFSLSCFFICNLDQNHKLH